jgi:hypothetical protein
MDRKLLEQKSDILADVSHKKPRYGKGLRVEYCGDHIGYIKENEGASGGWGCFDDGGVYLDLYATTTVKATLKLVEWHQNQQSQ